jgi:hypothetical protein
MKPAIFYALVTGWSRHGNGFQVIAVTSEKGGQIYGRDENEYVTHRSARDMLHRFDDEASAKGAHERAAAAKAKLQPAVSEAHRMYQRLDKEMGASILAAAKGEELPAEPVEPKNPIAAFVRDMDHAGTTFSRCDACGHQTDNHLQECDIWSDYQRARPFLLDAAKRTAQ